MVASLDTYPLQPEILQILKSTYESEDAVGSCSLRLLVQAGQSGRQHRKDSRPSDLSSIALTALIALPRPITEGSYNNVVRKCHLSALLPPIA